MSSLSLVLSGSIRDAGALRVFDIILSVISPGVIAFKFYLIVSKEHANASNQAKSIFLSGAGKFTPGGGFIKPEAQLFEKKHGHCIIQVKINDSGQKVPAYFRAAGMTDHLGKPFNMNSIIEKPQDYLAARTSNIQ